MVLPRLEGEVVVDVQVRGDVVVLLRIRPDRKTGHRIDHDVTGSSLHGGVDDRALGKGSVPAATSWTLHVSVRGVELQEALLPRLDPTELLPEHLEDR